MVARSWASSAANWPSKAGLSVDQQKREMIDILDRCAALHLNAIILQVRPAADALYKSDIEPILSEKDLAAPTLAEAEESGLLPSYADCMAYQDKLRAIVR